MSEGHFIGSERLSEGEYFESREPARPSSLVGRFALGGVEATDRAVAAAVGAREGWERTGLLARGEIVRRAGLLLRERQDELADLVAREVGKPIREARAELQRAAVTCDYVASQARLSEGELYSSDDPGAVAFYCRRPLGVVGIVTPWNFPVGLPLWKLAPALLYGNPVVWKAAEHSPASAAALFGVWRDAGLPPGVLNLLFGGAKTGRALVEHPGVAGVSFTGSTTVGRSIAGPVASRGARLQLELGGKNAVLVLEDADLDAASALIVQGAASYAGQKCSATSRVVVAESAHDELVARIIDGFRNLRIGDPIEETTDVGPLIDAPALDRTQEYLREAVASGGDLLYGGDQLEGAGHFMQPALIEGLDPQSRLGQEEVFGPLLCLFVASDLDHAIDIVNATEFGFFTTICSRRADSVLELARRLESGIVKLNAPTTAADPHLPFGGWKASGNSTPEQGLEARSFFTRIQTVYLRPSGDYA